MSNFEQLQLSAGGDHLGLEVQFRWAGDRYAHRVLLRAAQTVTTLLESIEGCSDEVWPSSPPIQQITRHDFDSAVSALLGIGMAGRNHWSLSVQAVHDPVALEFDVACRAVGDGTIGRLVSSYQTTSAILRRSDREVVVQHSQSAVRCRMALHPMGDDVRTEIQMDDTTARVQAIPRDALGPATIRWRYRFVPCPADDIEST